MLIIRREARNDQKLDSMWADIYYKRKGDIESYDPYHDMIESFSCKKPSDFDIFSSLDDAINHPFEAWPNVGSIAN